MSLGERLVGRGGHAVSEQTASLGSKEHTFTIHDKVMTDIESLKVLKSRYLAHCVVENTHYSQGY